MQPDWVEVHPVDVKASLAAPCARLGFPDSCSELGAHDGTMHCVMLQCCAYSSGFPALLSLYLWHPGISCLPV